MKATPESTSGPEVSVLIPISERHDDIGRIYATHHEVLKKLGITHEFIFVLDGSFEQAETALKEIRRQNPTVAVITFNRWHGEAKALSAAFGQARGRLILTLSAYFQVQPEEIAKLFAGFSDDTDLIVGSRYPRNDNRLNRLQSRIFHRLISGFTKETFHDISCGVRLMRREVFEKINLYGDLHRFFPILAMHKGFRVKEMPLAQAIEDFNLRIYSPGVYLRRLLDILTLFFLIKFTQKPLRFFGLLGGGIGAVGLLISTITILQRLFGAVSLADRPLFLVGVLLSLIGLQTFFIGLIGEIIIFTHMPEAPHYNIEEIVE